MEGDEGGDRQNMRRPQSRPPRLLAAALTRPFFQDIQGKQLIPFGFQKNLKKNKSQKSA